MKKYLVILLSLVFVLSTIGFAVADDAGMDSVRAMKPGAKVLFGGDARVRGSWFKNHTFDSDADNDVRLYDQRIRLKIQAESGNGFAANTRFYITNSPVWDGTSNTQSTDILVDYAYITLPISTVKVNAGLIKRYYPGNKFMGDKVGTGGPYDRRFDSLEVVGTFETVTVTAFTNKIDETSPVRPQPFVPTKITAANTVTGDANLQDFNDYGLILDADIGDIQAGALVVYHHDNRETGGDNNDDGTDFSLWAKGNMEGISAGAEVVFLTGDLNKDDPTGADKTPFGFMLFAETTVGAVGVRLDGAYAANTYTANYSYTPTLATGTVTQTGLYDFGAESDAKAWLIAGSVNTDVMENVNVKGIIGYTSIEEAGGGDNANLFELDGVIKVQLAKNARYFVEAAYINPGGDAVSDDADAAVIVANRAELYF